VLGDDPEVLDMDGSGTINFDEFLHGTLRPFATGPSDPGMWCKDIVIRVIIITIIYIYNIYIYMYSVYIFSIYIYIHYIYIFSVYIYI
jgi:hypothetical protein